MFTGHGFCRWLLLAFVVLLIQAGLVRAQDGVQVGVQVGGQVVQLGFDNYYRPGSWVPVKVRISAPTAQYELRITQRDADGDRVLFTRQVVVTGDAQSGARQQEFWAYFFAEPMDGGLPEQDSTELMQRLRITLHTANGTEVQQISTNRQLPRSLDPRVTAGGGTTKGNRLILLVNGVGTNTRAFSEPERVIGTLENYNFLAIRPDQLPQSAVGLDMVDAVVWCNSLPGEITQDPLRLAALREWVRRGGHLVIATPAQWQQLESFGDLLPVTINSVAPVSNIPGLNDAIAAEQFVAPNVRLASAVARPQTLVAFTSNPVDSEKNASPTTAPATNPAIVANVPVLVRMGYGYGCVSWLAVDLADPALTRDAMPWLKLWPMILGYNDDPRLKPSDVVAGRLSDWVLANDFATARDLGASVVRGMSQAGTAAALVGIAAIFFIAYWLIAGPALFFILRYYARSTFNWLGFAALALAATVFTLGVVRIVLSGPPSIAHYSVFRSQSQTGIVAAAPSVITSRFGLYVRRNTEMPVTLDAGDGSFTSYVIPFPQHAILRDSDEVTVAAPRDYAVKMPTEPGSQQLRIDPYFRTTLKRFSATWSGNKPVGIAGSPALTGPRFGDIEGQLQNLTGQDLTNVYLVFSVPINQSMIDYLHYFPQWKANELIDLKKVFDVPADNPMASRVGRGNRASSTGRPVIGSYDALNALDPDVGWHSAWFGGDFRTSAITFSPQYDDSGSFVPTSIPLLSCFSRVSPMVNRKVGSVVENTRVELRRSGARDLDMSSAITAGNMVVIAQAAGSSPIPAPVKINDDQVTSSGTVVYQFVLPLKRNWPKPENKP